MRPTGLILGMCAVWLTIGFASAARNSALAQQISGTAGAVDFRSLPSLGPNAWRDTPDSSPIRSAASRADEDRSWGRGHAPATEGSDWAATPTVPQWRNPEQTAFDRTAFEQTPPERTTLAEPLPEVPPMEAYDPAFGFVELPATQSSGPTLSEAWPVEPAQDVIPNAPVLSWDRWNRPHLRFYMAGAQLKEQVMRLPRDFVHFYSLQTWVPMTVAFGGGAIMANTSIDQGFRDWYQDDVRSSGTDDLASFWKTFGEGDIFIPTFACLGLFSSLFQDTTCGHWATDYSYRVTRGYLIGAPPMLLMQWVKGASRPGETDHDSYWRPFEDTNGVSGHSFVGAMPFITAAMMTDDIFFKSLLYFASTLTAWSRVNDDAHYLSQSFLGWSMAYLTCRSIYLTEVEQGSCRVAIAPMVAPGMAGIGLTIRR